jgi:nucleotide-binding universal stress UspA family protein
MMGQKILIAFDESENSQRSVEFVSRAFSLDSQVTLFSVMLDAEGICTMQSPELTPYFKSQQQAFCTMEDKKKEVVMEALQKSKDILMQSGFDKDSITVKTLNRQKGIARDIISEANSGDYDVVVLGKKGVSSVKDFILGSISQKVIQGVKNTSVLLVD